MNALVRVISEFLHKGELGSRDYHGYIERTVSSPPDCLHLVFNPLSSTDSCRVSDTRPTARAGPRPSLYPNLNVPGAERPWPHFVFLSSLSIWWRLTSIWNTSFTKKDSVLPELSSITSTAKETTSSSKMLTIFTEQNCSINSDLIVLIQSLLQFPSAGITSATKHFMAWKILCKLLKKKSVFENDFR